MLFISKLKRATQALKHLRNWHLFELFALALNLSGKDYSIVLYCFASPIDVRTQLIRLS